MTDVFFKKWPWRIKIILQNWPTRSWQVSHQRWIWGVHRTQVTKHTSKGNQSGSETLGRHHQMPKTGVSVARQKGLLSSKMLEKLLYIILTTPDEDISRHSSGVRPMEASAGSSTAMIDWLTRPDRWVRTVFRCRQWASPTIVMLKWRG